MVKEAAYWIETLRLEEHPEGGYYRRTYRAREEICREHLPERFSGPRAISSAIYYLLPGGCVSAFHRLKSDEMWHFYTGSALIVYVLDGDGRLVEKRLGADPERGEAFQHLIEAGNWFGAVVTDPASYSLVGCTVAPGFDFEDFEMADPSELMERYPEHRALIARLMQRGSHSR
jgi:uncharacterized protein